MKIPRKVMNRNDCHEVWFNSHDIIKPSDEDLGD